MKKIVSMFTIALLALTACSTDAEAEPETVTETATAPPENQHIFDDGVNSVVLTYRWIPPEGSTTSQPKDGRYTYDVRIPGDNEGPADSFMSGITPGVDPEFPSEFERNFYMDYVPVPDGERIYTAGHLSDDSAPDGAGVECMIVSLDGEGILASEISFDPIAGAVCEYEF